MKKYLFLVVLLGLCGCTQSRLQPEGLRCEYLVNPYTVDVAQPRLSWINRPVSRKVQQEGQSAWQILAATSPRLLEEGQADLWDSGRREGDASHLVPYEGAALPTMTTCYWKVRVWDSQGQVSRWSKTACWGTGIEAKQWNAKWIGAPWQEDIRFNWYPRYPMFRKEFSVGPGLKEARAYVSGLGWFEMSLNGQKVGDDYFVPGFTDYTYRPYAALSKQTAIDAKFTYHRCLYVGYDITALLKKGPNAVGILLGNGYFHTAPTLVRRPCEPFGTPRLIAHIELIYQDGHREEVVTDENWMAAPSPIVFGDLWQGEVFDAREEIPGWDTVKTDESAWTPAVEVKAPDGALCAQMAPTDKVMERLRPVSFSRLEDGSYKVDFGQVISGWIRFKGIRGQVGDTLKVNYQGEYKSPRCEYVFASSGKVDWAPRFSWFVFREAIISGIDDLSAKQLVAEAVNSDVPVNAEFRCSNPMLEDILELFRRAQKDNMHSGVASDCPHRERLPYTGDAQVAMAAVMASFDADAFYNKWIGDILGAQNPETGYVPNGAPWEAMCGGGVPWGAAICVMPWEFYCRYGDKQLLQKSLEGMKGYVRYLSQWERKDGTILSEKTKPDGTPTKYLNLGDWAEAFGLPELALVHTFYYWYCSHLTAQAAAALGDTETALQYEEKSAAIKAAFHRCFYDASAKSYGDYGSNVYALYMGVPDECLDDVRATLREELGVRYGGHLNTGFIATRFLFETLAMNGMSDLAYEIITKRDFPSYGWFLEQGATTLWEYWGGQHSHNHPMYGGGLTWYSRVLAGVDTDPAEPGFRHILIRPIPVVGLDEVSYRTQTPYGPLASYYSCRDDKVTLKVEIPAGCHATIWLPRSASEASARPFDENAYEIHECLSGTWTLK